MKIKYAEKKFSDEKLVLVAHANEILDRYSKYPLTLRGLYYQMVARNVIENTSKSYDRFGALISDARIGGLVDWSSIYDETRSLRGKSTNAGPVEAVEAAREAYRRDLWEAQDFQPEVWFEKRAMIGALAGVCDDLRVDYFPTGGYNSQSAAWEAAQRLGNYVERGQRPMIFYLGDHDPSGIDMTRDVADRLALFAGIPIQVVRLALNRDQVDRYALPPNPVKRDLSGRLTDSRAAAYVEEHGDESWEMDALPPDILAGIVRDSILRLRDEATWSEALAEEADEKDDIDLMIESRRTSDE